MVEFYKVELMSQMAVTNDTLFVFEGKNYSWKPTYIIDKEN